MNGYCKVDMAQAANLSTVQCMFQFYLLYFELMQNTLLYVLCCCLTFILALSLCYNKFSVFLPQSKTMNIMILNLSVGVTLSLYPGVRLNSPPKQKQQIR